MTFVVKSQFFDLEVFFSNICHFYFFWFLRFLSNFYFGFIKLDLPLMMIESNIQRSTTTSAFNGINFLLKIPVLWAELIFMAAVNWNDTVTLTDDLMKSHMSFEKKSQKFKKAECLYFQKSSPFILICLMKHQYLRKQITST